MKKTKIIATLGPVSEAPEMITKLIEEGVNVFRLNFSHGDHAEQGARIATIKKVREKLGLNIGILADLQGPKIRVGVVDMELIPGKEVILACDEAAEGEIPVQYRDLYKDVKAGDQLLLDDGLLELKLIEVKGEKIIAEVVVGGHLSSKKGINLPTGSISAEVITEKDRRDAEFALEQGVDFLALSFVKTAQDINDLRKIIENSSNKKAKIIAKIERHEAIQHLDEIIAATDLVMVARGDLGVELSSQKVPMLQKKMIRKCLMAGKQVIVATQMLDSMIRNPRPTRAETSDIANAILDGADATMLSGETSAGIYPLEAVKTMARIALDTEKWMVEEGFVIGKRLERDLKTVAESIALAATELAKTTKSKYIVAATASGKTVTAVSRFRPHSEIIAVTHNDEIARKLTLNSGVFPISFSYNTNRELVDKVSAWLLDCRIAKKKDTITVVSGYTHGEVGGTNIIRVHQI